MAVEYQINIADPNGNRIGVIDSFLSFEYQRVVNQVGFLDIVVPFGAYPVSWFEQDTIFQLWRQVDGNKPYLEGETSFYQHYWKKTLKSDGSKTFEVYATDPLEMVFHRIVPYPAETTYTSKTGPIDDMMKAVMRENFGSLATDTDRNYEPDFVVQVDLSKAPSSFKGFAHRRILDVLQEWAKESYTKGTYLAFDVICNVPLVGHGLEFRTYIGYRGVDHRKSSTDPLFFSPENGNILEAMRSDDNRDMYNFVYAGGQGLGQARILKTQANLASIGEAPMNRQELWVDARNTNDPGAVQAEADQALYDNRTRRTFTGRIIDIPSLRYGVQYNFGDFITVDWDNEAIDARVDGVNIKMQEGVETVNLALRTDL